MKNMVAAFCVDCGLQLTGRYCGACGRDYGATDAAQRASCPLATAQQAATSARVQQDVLDKLREFDIEEAAVKLADHGFKKMHTLLQMTDRFPKDVICSLCKDSVL